MDKEMDKGNKKEAIDPVMMEEDQINKIMATWLERSTMEYLTNIK